MRLFLDETVQHRLASLLQADGHDATHVRLVGMQGASDKEVMAYAAAETRVLVTTDTDFGALLALSGATRPSVVLLRGVGMVCTSAMGPSCEHWRSCRTNCDPASLPWSSPTASDSGRCR